MISKRLFKGTFLLFPSCLGGRCPIIFILFIRYDLSWKMVSKRLFIGSIFLSLFFFHLSISLRFPAAQRGAFLPAQTNVLGPSLHHRTRVLLGARRRGMGETILLTLIQIDHFLFFSSERKKIFNNFFFFQETKQNERWK